MSNTLTQRYIPAVVWIFVSFIPAIIGRYFTPGSWYQEILKPEWTPPGWIFGPVWFLLYLSMGIAATIIWRSKENHKIQLPIAVFLVQLILNALWSWIFFGLYELFYSVVEISVLLSMIIVMIILFYKVSKKAGLLLIPYLLWVSFATVLNYNIWILNR